MDLAIANPFRHAPRDPTTMREKLLRRLAPHTPFLSINSHFANGFGQTDRVDMVHFGPVMALLGAAGNYLAARGRHIKTFNGLDLKSDRGWQQLFQAVETMLAGLVQERSS